ncbi:enoyl-CoA hydratase/isomerase family protein [Natronomonas salsuginis]|jgi:enoyl-CoA hydratase/carnithine racemase|nr:enoyl-CoA hydratase/isomerase family protein [Natronomonas salsuginis]
MTAVRRGDICVVRSFGRVDPRSDTGRNTEVGATATVAMASDNVLVDRTDGRVDITLNRPEKSNAMTGGMYVRLGEIFEELADEDVSVVTIRGTGGNFSAGVDMSDVPEWAEMNPLDVRDLLEPVHEALRTIEAFDGPVVAALEGHVLGGGLELAVACDIRIADTTAQFGLPESTMGLAMDLGGAQKLPGMIGEGMTKYLIMTGEPIDADRAHEVGLVEELHEPGAFDDAVDDLAATLASKPAYIHGLAKRQVHSVRPPNLDESMSQAIHHAIAAYQEPETQRRVAEFFE